MHTIPPYTIYACGDHALTISFGNLVDATINRQVLSIFNRLARLAVAGVKDIIPAYSSITVVYDVVALKKAYPAATAYSSMVKTLQPCLNGADSIPAETLNIVRVPVCYDAAFAPDLHEMAAVKNVPPETIVQWHTAKTYRVFMLGFLPGFAYMGSVGHGLETPRKNIPRKKVPAGSVGIAGRQTGVYPAESPGGWNIIGQTPLKMFDIKRAQPALLKPGDYVQFYAIGPDEFENLKTAEWASA